MPQDPAQRGFVIGENPVEETLARAIQTSVPEFALRPQKFGAHHGSGSERNKQRDGDSNRQSDGKFAKQPAHDSAHQQNGNEDGD